MNKGIPRLEAIDASPLADLATKHLTRSLEATRNDQATAEATISTACATLAMVGEIHRLRVAVEKLQSAEGQ